MREAWPAALGRGWGALALRLDYCNLFFVGPPLKTSQKLLTGPECRNGRGPCTHATLLLHKVSILLPGVDQVVGGHL